jgi:hypothetical protein
MSRRGGGAHSGLPGNVWARGLVVSPIADSERVSERSDREKLAGNVRCSSDRCCCVSCN